MTAKQPQQAYLVSYPKAEGGYEEVPPDKAITYSTWKNVIRGHTVAEMLPQPERPLAFVWREDSVLETLQVLNSAGVLSCPIYDEKTNQVLGLIDVADIVAYFARRTLGTATDPKAKKEALDELWGRKIEYLLNMSERNWWFEIKEDSSMEVAFNMLDEMDLKRMVVFEKDNPKRVKAILTQFDVIKWISKNLDRNLCLMKHVPDEKLKVSEILHRKPKRVNQVITLPHTTKVIDAFEKMYEAKVSAFPLVNEFNKLVGTISTSDICGALADPENLVNDLQLPCGEWIVKAKSVKPTVDKRLLGKPVVAKLEDSVVDVFHRLIEHEVHRIWVVDNGNRVTDVISLCDLIYVFNHY